MAKGARQNAVHIDRVAFESELSKKGIDINEIAKEIGRSKSYLTNFIPKDKLPVYVVGYLEKWYGINKDSYLIKSGNRKGNQSELHPIDWEKFDKIRKRLGKTKSELSRELGYSETYVNGVKHRGGVPLNVIRHLDREYGIKYEEYKLADEPCEEKNPESKIDLRSLLIELVENTRQINEKLNNLDKTITDANYPAIINAFMAIMPELLKETKKNSFDGVNQYFVKSGLIDEYLKD